ncbi:MAG TPA: DUF362 domain-containing protein, partial [Candidatus Methylomirabilis sp.]|nr:DUF362 domain-containing protein [Candidatus Methylomirabilis sp.]
GLKNPLGMTLPVLPGYTPRLTGYWVPKGEHEKSFALAKKMVEATTDFSWLSRGDRVLVKLALNSGYPYPRTTDPWLLDAMLKMLREKGARIVVGDSGGCGNVRWAPSEKRGSTRELAEKAGLLAVITQNGATPVFFEEQEYDTFLETFPTGDHHWKKPMRITSTVEEVDHIIYVPRISSHVLADFTAGLKVGVGFLREDSRLTLHESAGDYAPMFEEINHVPEIEPKLRLVVSSGRMIPTLVGPDMGPVATPDHGLYMASTDLLAHDLLAYAWIKWAREFMTSPEEHAKDGAVMKNPNARNNAFLKNSWKLPQSTVIPDLAYFQAGDTGTIYDHPAMVNFMRREGGRPEKIQFEQLSLNPDAAVVEYLRREINA